MCLNGHASSSSDEEASLEAEAATAPSASQGLNGSTTTSSKHQRGNMAELASLINGQGEHHARSADSGTTSSATSDVRKASGAKQDLRANGQGCLSSAPSNGKTQTHAQGAACSDRHAAALSAANGSSQDNALPNGKGKHGNARLHDEIAGQSSFSILPSWVQDNLQHLLLAHFDMKEAPLARAGLFQVRATVFTLIIVSGNSECISTCAVAGTWPLLPGMVSNNRQDVSKKFLWHCRFV